MEKLNSKKDSIIEILRLVEEKMMGIDVRLIPCPSKRKGTRLYCFTIYFYEQEEDKILGDVYFEQIGHLIG